MADSRSLMTPLLLFPTFFSHFGLLLRPQQQQRHRLSIFQGAEAFPIVSRVLQPPHLLLAVMWHGS